MAVEKAASRVGFGHTLGTLASIEPGVVG